MTTLLKSSSSTYAGFLNGFIAGNLTENSQELNFHTDKIAEFLSELRKEVVKWGLEAEKEEKIITQIDGSNNLFSVDNSENKYLALGDSLFKLFEYILQFKPQPQIPSTANFILKKIVYHFLNIAKTSQFSKVIRKAKKIAEKFDGK